MKRLILAAVSAVAIAAGAAPASASHIAERAQDEQACAHQLNSPRCSPTGEPGGFETQHNETLARDA